ncbi:MAG: DUF2141 domain-containing protein [Pseudomonadota bacterium]
MARKFLIALTVVVWTLALTEMTRADTLTIHIEDVHVAEGTLMLQVMGSTAEFADEAPATAAFQQKAQKGPMSYTVTLPPGTYALRVMHDVNDNGKLDANFVGIPSEPWAFSNNATGNFGPPEWSDVQFIVDGDTTQQLKLNK